VHWHRDENYYSDDWHGTLEKEGGGVTVNQAIHTQDLLRYLIGSDTVSVTAQAGADGRLYGSVTAKDIAEQLAKRVGADIDKRKILLKDTIKAYGKHDVQIKILGDIVAKFIVYVHD
jgi:ribosomal protein L9